MLWFCEEKQKRKIKETTSNHLPVDILAAVSKCSTVFVKFGNFVVVVVVFVVDA